MKKKFTQSQVLLSYIWIVKIQKLYNILMREQGHLNNNWVSSFWSLKSDPDL